MAGLVRKPIIDKNGRSGMRWMRAEDTPPSNGPSIPAATAPRPAAMPNSEAATLRKADSATTTVLVDALVDDIRDLLETSAVGLYEFIWILRGMDATLGSEAMREQASVALQRLLDDGQGRLVLLRWPPEDVVGTCMPADVGPDAWEDPSLTEPYIAIMRN